MPAGFLVRRRWRGLVLVLVVAFGLGACDSNDEGTEGSFGASVLLAGQNVGTTLQGRAFFSIDSADGGSFVIEMIPRRGGGDFQDEGLVLGRAGASPPAAGNYAIAALGADDALPEQAFAGAWVRSFSASGEPALYYATGLSGDDLEITVASPERVEGNFRFEAELDQRRGNTNAPSVVTIAGEFTAVGNPNAVAFPR